MVQLLALAVVVNLSESSNAQLTLVRRLFRLLKDWGINVDSIVLGENDLAFSPLQVTRLSVIRRLCCVWCNSHHDLTLNRN